MIEVRMAVEQDLDVFDREAEVGDVLLDDWRGFGQAAIQQNRALRCLDKKRRDVGCADIVNVADDAERLDRLVPLGALFGAVLRN